MVSSSASRSRSVRRSPSRRREEAVSKSPVKETPEAPSAPPETSAPPELSVPAAPSAPPDSEECEKPKQWKGWFDDNDGGKSRASRHRSVGGGAVRNRRTAGTPGTFECPECYRVIQDNKTARDQHWDSRYCRARRLYNRGYGTQEECLQLADYEINKAWQKWNASQGVRLTDRPNEPKGPPPEGKSSGSAEHFVQQRQQSDAGYQRYRGRSPAGKRRSVRGDEWNEKRERERTRERSHGRSRKDEGHEHTERRRRERRRDGDDVGYVKVTVEREPHPAASDRRKQSRPETMRGSKQKDAKEKGVGRNVERREAGKETAESSEYTYTYDDSSASEEPKPGAQKLSAPPDAAKKSAEEQRAKKPEKPGAAQGTAAKAKAGGPAAAQPSSGGGADQRRMAYFNALLRTAMETADSCGF